VKKDRGIRDSEDAMNSPYIHGTTSPFLAQRWITGLIRWDAALGHPRGDVADAFSLVVKRKNRPTEVQGSGSHSSTVAEPFEVSCHVSFSDASDENGKAVRFVIQGLSNNEEIWEGGFVGDGYYEVAPQLKALWTDGFGMPALTVREVVPPYERVTLTDNNPVGQMLFFVEARSLIE
jgi:hypothetical protein